MKPGSLQILPPVGDRHRKAFNPVTCPAAFFRFDVAMPLSEVPESLTSTPALAEARSSSGAVHVIDGRKSRPSRHRATFNRETDDVAWRRQTFPEVYNCAGAAAALLTQLADRARCRGGGCPPATTKDGCLARVGRLVEISPLLGALHVIKAVRTGRDRLGYRCDT